MATAAKNAWPTEWDTTDALEQLIAQFNAASNYYTPKTAEDILAQATGEYKTYYDQQRLAANQAQQQSDLALQQQLAGLQTTYDKSRKASQKQYDMAYSQADRGMIGRGMQRSSYGAQTLANLSQQGAEAQQALWDEQAAAEGNINAQRAQIAKQLAQQLQQFDISQANDIQNRKRELEEQEYQRGLENTQYKAKLSDQIYNYLLDRENAAASSGGSGGNGGTNPTTTTTTNNSTNPLNSWNNFLNALNGAATTPAGVTTSKKEQKYQQKTAYANSTANKTNKFKDTVDQRTTVEDDKVKKKKTQTGGGSSKISQSRMN